MTGFSRVAAGAVGLVAVALAAYVTAGMVDGLDPQSERGVSPTGAIVAQEALGVVTLGALANVLRKLAARDGRLAPAVIALLAAVLAATTWLVALVAERAS